METLNSDPKDKNPTEIRLLQVALIGVVILIISPFLIPIALGFVFGSLLWPTMQKPWRRIESRGLKAFILTTGFTTLIVAPVVTMIVAGVLALQKKLTDGSLSNLSFHPSSWLTAVLNNDVVVHIQDTLNITDQQVRTTLLSAAQRVQDFAIEFLQTILTSAPEAGLAFLIMIFCLFWILRDQEEIESWIFEHSPWTKRQTTSLIDTFRDASVSVVLAGIASGVAQATIIGTGAAVSGVGNPSAAAMIVFFASFFPVLGSGAVSLSLIAFGIVTGEFDKVILFLPFALVSSIADNIIYPLVVGGRIEMNPLISFLAVLGGIQIFGLFGIFLGPIVLILCVRALAIISGANPQPRPKKKPSRFLLKLQDRLIMLGIRLRHAIGLQR